jgi:16S rRNA G1207 methylase RsmC
LEAVEKAPELRSFLVDEEREAIESSAETLRCATIEKTSTKSVGDGRNRMCQVDFPAFLFILGYC